MSEEALKLDPSCSAANSYARWLDIDGNIRKERFYVLGITLYYDEEHKLHRLDGPADESASYSGWYYHGEQFDCSTQQEFERILKLKAF